ncbi:hypothetical protein F6U93_13795 [Tamlana haliotis]|uniref:Uncharacterized protein n=1 Tax=Pseudotamlana haliotis TaxID=2614804 RepID=A0A6N6M8A3_9FLAO|nr:hypothetical protein [Tamlana haliotis]KAB1066492.1 hypothetical protein F6U93_13795 [Tamlana haliotis]
MTYQEAFVDFWEQVKASVQEERFAKLTMAKTIGKPDLKNIFVRPLASEGDFKVLLKFSYRLKETEDEEQELSLEQAFEVLKSHLKKPFLTVLLFTTTKDVTFKINKKGVGSFTEGAPTFQDVRLADRD